MTSPPPGRRPPSRRRQRDHRRGHLHDSGRPRNCGQIGAIVGGAVGLCCICIALLICRAVRARGGQRRGRAVGIKRQSSGSFRICEEARPSPRPQSPNTLPTTAANRRPSARRLRDRARTSSRAPRRARGRTRRRPRGSAQRSPRRRRRTRATTRRRRRRGGGPASGRCPQSTAKRPRCRRSRRGRRAVRCRRCRRGAALPDDVRPRTAAGAGDATRGAATAQLLPRAALRPELSPQPPPRRRRRVAHGRRRSCHDRRRPSGQAAAGATPKTSSDSTKFLSSNDFNS